MRALIKRLTVISVSIMVMTIIPKSGMCWDKYGHMLIAEVAYEKLSKPAKSRIDHYLSVLQNDPHIAGLEDKYKPYNAVTIGAWMDDMRLSKVDTGSGHTSEFNPWHYVDLPDQTTKAELMSQFNNDAEPNVYNAIVNHCLKTLNDQSASDADKARMYGMLVHLVADIHQPMHATARQKGATEYPIKPLPNFDPSSPWHMDNLHAYWDNAYRYDIEDDKLVLTCTNLDMPRNQQPDLAELKKVTRDILGGYMPRNKQSIKDLDPADWVLESLELARTKAFPKDNQAVLGNEFIRQSHDIACERMALAGCRLAELLNEIFK